jgi:DNA replication ATP-dependent helicase Dna2
MNNGASAVKTAAKPLEPVSEATKSKLNAFTFCPPADTPEHKDDPIALQHPEAEMNHATPLKSAKQAASTPANRLAWQDLIGMPQVQEAEEDTSPNERLQWDTSLEPGYRMSPMLPRKRGKKRARSSSPTSSPGAISSKPNTPAVNVRKLSEALKSPYADPALQLWDRFSLSGSSAPTPLGANSPALAHVMVSSSPKLPRAPGAPGAPGAPSSEGGLRRAISCGANWPKRRRADRTEPPLVPVSATIEESPSGTSKSSMVNALLRSVTGEINKSKVVHAHNDVLKSPSPQKRGTAHMAHSFGSPSRQPPASRPTPPLFKNDEPGSTAHEPARVPPADASDYEDDDFDDDTFMELDAALMPGDQDEVEHPVPPPPLPPPLDGGQSMHGRQQHLESSEDEFADLDDDVVAAAEDLVAQIDSTHPSAPSLDLGAGSQVTPTRQIESCTKGDSTTEDTYGDDFGGDFDFEAAEMAATQSTKRSNGPIPAVRR